MAWRNLPNAITLGRIVLAAVVAPMLLTDSLTAGGWRRSSSFWPRRSRDLWDGHLARSRNLISDFGKLMDPLADKLLLAATFVPFYILSHCAEPETRFPWFGWTFPLWILIVIFGRELFITVFRGFAARRGVVLAAGKAGKLKAVFQNIFIGAAIFWYALQSAAREHALGREAVERLGVVPHGLHDGLPGHRRRPDGLLAVRLPARLRRALRQAAVGAVSPLRG